MRISLAFSLLLLTSLCYGQPFISLQFGHSFVFETNTIEGSTGVRQPIIIRVSDTAVYRIFDSLRPDAENSSGDKSRPKSPIILGVKLNPGLTNYFSNIVKSVTKDFSTYTISDSSEALLVAMGITSANIKNYRYRVVENDSMELIPWSPIPALSDAYGARQLFGMIGSFRSPGKTILVEVVNRHNYAERDGVIFDWRKDFRPVLDQITVELSKTYFNLASTHLNRGYATRFAPFSQVPLNFSFPADSVRNILFSFHKQETVASSAHLIRHTKELNDTIRMGFIDAFGMFNLRGDDFKRPGKYELVFQRQARYPDFDPDKSFRIPFQVLENDSRGRDPWKIFSSVLTGLLLLVFGGDYISRRLRRRRLRQLSTQKEVAQLRIKNIRAQLNPHFMFNALSSIQNMVNKNEIKEANHYLIRFAALTRAVLENSEADLISLSAELAVNEHYLLMERLRFGFNYQIECDKHLNTDNIEIPPMLLQPFIENAIKHGVTDQKDGKIIIRISQKSEDLVLQVIDNGKGFSTEATTESGFGIRLTKEKFKLLNELFPDNVFKLDMSSGAGGTTITVTLINWI